MARVKGKVKEEKKTEEKKPAAKKSAAKKTETKKVAKPAKKTEKEYPELTDEMIENIQNEMEDFKENLEKSTRFNAAAKRARKNTTTLEKLFKTFRKATIGYWSREE